MTNFEEGGHVRNVKMENHNQKIYIAMTGGGSRFVSDILSSGGASAFLIGVEIPYSTESLDVFVGGLRDKCCSESTARQLASVAEEKAVLLGYKGATGIGITASLMKGEGEREGRANRFFYAAKRQGKIISIEVNIDKVKFPTRDAQENLCADLANKFTSAFTKYINDGLHLVGTTLQDLFYLTSHDEGYKINIPHEKYVDICESLSLVAFHDSDVFTNFYKERKQICIFPGSFNPLHADHERNFHICCEKFGWGNTFLEISIDNYEKPRLDALELQKRIEGMRRLTPNIVITKAPFFIDKVELFTRLNVKNKIFAMGADTYSRIADHCKGWSFLVFPRDGKNILDIMNDKNTIHPYSFELSEGSNLKSSEIRKQNNE